MIKIKKIEGVGLACNCFIITDIATGISAIVDAGLSKAEFDKVCDGKSIKFVLLTHGHYDHILSADYICEKCNAELIIHENDADFLTDSYLNLSEPFGFPPVKIKSTPKLIGDGDIINLGETEIRVMLTSGHTKGSVCYIADDIMLCGDTLFNGAIGRTDFPTSDASLMQKSLTALCSLEEDYRLFCGHGEDSTLFYEKANNPYLNKDAWSFIF